MPEVTGVLSYSQQYVFDDGSVSIVLFDRQLKQLQLCA